MLFSLALLATGQAGAQTIKPGLWELNNKVKTGDTQADAAMSAALKQLGNMPPEQRAQMEAMLAQNGVSMPKPGSDGGMLLTACVTPEMAARQQLPINQKGKCTSKNESVAGGMNISFSCTEPASSGHGTLRFNGDSGYVMNMNVTSAASGTPRNVTMESTGRWLGASCPAKPR